MTDFLVKRLPAYVNQFKRTTFAPSPSGYRSVTASAAMVIDYADPGKYDPDQVEHDLYVRYAGPDVASDHNELSKDQLKAILVQFQVGFIDMDNLVQEALHGDPAALLHEIEAQNEQQVIQILTVADESFLKEAGTGKKLHNWNDTGLSHCFVRVGFSDSDGYGLYLEPAAPGFCTDPATGQEKPVRIAWADIVAARVITCIAIMPPGVEAPPDGFSFQNAQWPTPPAPTKPPVDTDKATQAILALIAACQKQDAALQTYMQQQSETNKTMQEALNGALATLKPVEEQETILMEAIKSYENATE